MLFPIGAERQWGDVNKSLESNISTLIF